MAKKTYDGDKPLMGDVVGMPDEWDRKNIQTIINNYHAKNPKDIPRAIVQGRDAPDAQYGKKNSSFGIHRMELPAPLHKTIEEAYPLMFRDKNQFAWFKKNFKSLLL